MVSLSPMNSMRAKRETGSLMPFKELIQDLESCPDQSFKRGREVSVRDPGGSILPNPSALMHVTNRRKALVKQKNAILVRNNTSCVFWKYILVVSFTQKCSCFRTLVNLMIYTKKLRIY